MPLLKASSIARRSSPGANSEFSDERFCWLMIKSFKTGILLIDDQACTLFRRYNNNVFQCNNRSLDFSRSLGQTFKLIKKRYGGRWACLWYGSAMEFCNSMKELILQITIYLVDFSTISRITAVIGDQFRYSWCLKVLKI